MKPLQERDHVDAGAIAKLLLVMIVLGIAAIGFSTWLLGRTPDRGSPKPAPRTIGSIEQTPITRTAAGLELQDRQRASLDEWRWVDRDAGVGTIPIDRAMSLVSGEKP